MSNTSKSSGLTYADSGVDIDAGDALIDRIKPLAAATYRTGVMGSLGGFGGAFDLRAAGYDDPILISGTDGVGTKLKVAMAMDIYDTIGIDLVAMCVNDILAQGAEPLFFLDYFATGKLLIDRGADIIAGIAEGCRQSGCALIGGETAEMPGMYHGDDFDLAGFVVGAANRNALLPDHSKMHAGDILIALGSSGPHSNGFSLLRKVIEMSGLDLHDAAPFDASRKLGETVLAPTKLYVQSLLPHIRAGRIKGLAHITGGGIIENPPRMMPGTLKANIDLGSWDWPDLFKWVMETGGIERREMLRTFNCGMGMLLAVAAEDAQEILQTLKDSGEEAWITGEVANA